IRDNCPKFLRQQALSSGNSTSLRVQLLKLFRSCREFDEVPGGIRIRRESRNSKTPPAKCGRRPSTMSMDHRNQRNLCFHWRLRTLDKRTDVKPIPHENASAVLKQIARLFFRVRRASGWRNRSEARLEKRQGLEPFRARQQNSPIGTNPFAAVTPEHLEVIRYQSFVLLA